ncbi:MAG: PAS domain S-box protein [Burkholderiales bacterium]
MSLPHPLDDADPAASVLESLRQSEERYRLVVEHLGEGMFVVQNNCIVFSNRLASEIMRVPREEMMGADPIEWIHPQDRASLLELRSRLREKREIQASYELRHIGRDGVERWLKVRPTPMAWQGGQATLTLFSEITEHKEMAIALQRSEERYRAVIEHVDSGMVVLQNDRLVYANRRAAEITRMSPDELLSTGFWRRLHPQDLELILERSRRRLAGENVPNRYEVRLLFEDGSICWIELGVSIVPWEGKPATITFFSDVNERRQITQALHRSEERYRAVIEHSGEGMLVVQAGKVVFANARAAEMVHLSNADVLREGFLHRIHPEDRADFSARYRLRMSGQEVSSRYETRLLLPDSSVRWLDISVTVVPWDGGQATLSFFSDITERKKAEQELLRTASEREAILNNALVGIVLSVARRHEWVNEKFASMMGFAPAELIGRSSRYLYADEQTYEQFGIEARAELIATGACVNERQLRRRNGELFWVVMAGSCVRSHDPDSGVIWTFLDITERKKAEEDTYRALLKQAELNELRTRFVAMTSHEFRTPLASILSSQDLLKHYSERLPIAERQKILNTIETSVHRMTRMLDRVLLLGKADAQMLDFNPQELDLVSLCQSMVTEAQNQQAGSQCPVVLETPSETLVGQYDEKLLRHIFGNLLSNAIKYSPSGGEVRLKVVRRGTETEIEVSDHGIGIPADEIGHLFESFHRASNVGAISGTGLGLAIVKQSVALHGGSIELKSVVGKGTTFTITL